MRPLILHPDRLFPADPATRAIARSIYEGIKHLPIISPHGHTDPAWFAINAPFTNPTDLLIVPDHYVLRMLSSQGIEGRIGCDDRADTLTNGGTFVATKDSDFGAGTDLFANAGTVTFGSAKTPTAVSFLGLERFQNSGIVDLRNGIAGDTLTLPGGYVGSGNARLGLPSRA
jgi:hypothetical protein